MTTQALPQSLQSGSVVRRKQGYLENYMECEYSSIKSPFTSTFVGTIHSATLLQHFFQDALSLTITIKFN